MNFDLIVIGSGPGGYVASIRAAQLGLKTAIIEKDSLGGICLNWGCIPTKSLLKSAKIFNYLKNSSDYGFNIDNIEIDFPKIINQSRKIVNKMNDGINFLMKKNKIEVIYGVATMKYNNIINIELNDKIIEYTASNIIIATGTNPRKYNDNKIINYKEALNLSKLPNSIIIIGSGAIGVEFASFYNEMGVNVTIIEKEKNILPSEDYEISNELKKIFIKKGINIFTSSLIEKIECYNEQAKVFININNKEKKILESDIVFYAIGNIPNISNIGLENIGIKTKQGFIEVDKFYQTNIPSYYAIGDIIYGPSLAHVASAEGILCVEKIKGLNPIPLNYNNIPICIYSIPEIASVGYTEKEAIDKGYKIKIGKFFFNTLSKSVINRDLDGFVKVIFDEKYGEWLGCHMIGNNVSDIISEVVVARKLETTGYEIIKSIHPHPSLSEIIMEAVADAYGECIHK